MTTAVLGSIALLSLVACGSPPKPTKAESIRTGDELIAKKQYRQAAVAYRAAAQDDPDDGSLRAKLANAYVLAGDWSRAAVEADRAADRLGENVDLQLRAGALLLLQGEFAQARVRASGVLRAHPDNVLALIVSATAAAHLVSAVSALEDLDRAIQLRRQPAHPLSSDDRFAESSLRRAIELDPSNLVAQAALANFYWVVDRLDEAETPLKRAADGDHTPWETYYLPYLPRLLAVTRHALGSYYLSRHRDAEGEMYLTIAIRQGDWDARVVLADFYLRSNRNGEALELLAPMATEANWFDRVMLKAATAEFRLGRYGDAIQRLDRLLAKVPNNNRAVVLKAQCFLKTAAFDKALRFARDAVARDPKSSEARSTLGQALLETGDLSGAFDEYSEAVRLDPESTDLPLRLARLSVAAGRTQAATVYAREAARKNPDSQEAAVALVAALVVVGDYSAADRELQSLLMRYPNAPDVLAQAGAVHLGRGNEQAARTAYARALQLNPASRDAAAGLVAVDLKQHRVADARARIDALLTAHPDDAGYLLLAADVFIAGNDAPRAESTLRRALEVDPASERAALLLSDQLARRQRLDEAKRVLEQLLVRRPGSLDVQTAIGLRLEQMGRPADARAHYEKIVAQNSRAAKAGARLAALYVADSTNLDVALTLATSAKQQLPNDAAVSDVLGCVYAQKNLPKLALPHLREAVGAEPTNAQYRFHLATALMRTGQLPSARDEFTRALQIDPNSAEAPLAREALALLPK